MGAQTKNLPKKVKSWDSVVRDDLKRAWRLDPGASGSVQDFEPQAPSTGLSCMGLVGGVPVTRRNANGCGHGNDLPDTGIPASSSGGELPDQKPAHIADPERKFEAGGLTATGNRSAPGVNHPLKTRKRLL